MSLFLARSSTCLSGVVFGLDDHGTRKWTETPLFEDKNFGVSDTIKNTFGVFWLPTLLYRYTSSRKGPSLLLSVSGPTTFLEPHKPVDFLFVIRILEYIGNTYKDFVETLYSGATVVIDVVIYLKRRLLDSKPSFLMLHYLYLSSPVTRCPIFSHSVTIGDSLKLETYNVYSFGFESLWSAQLSLISFFAVWSITICTNSWVQRI